MSETNLATQPTPNVIALEPSCKFATDPQILQRIGFKIVTDDQRFYLYLPDGWTSHETETWYSLLDEAGHERGQILKSTLGSYQIVFLRCCFEIAIRAYEGMFGPLNYVFIVDHSMTKGHENAPSRRTITVYSDDPGLNPDLSAEYYHGMAEEYLNRQFPHWQNPLAYWQRQH